jgi:hypothetical protein
LIILLQLAIFLLLLRFILIFIYVLTELNFFRMVFRIHLKNHAIVLLNFNDILVLSELTLRNPIVKKMFSIKHWINNIIKLIALILIQAIIFSIKFIRIFILLFYYLFFLLHFVFIFVLEILNVVFNLLVVNILLWAYINIKLIFSRLLDF